MIIGSTCILYGLGLLYFLFLNHRGQWSSIPFSEYFMYQSNFIPFKTITGFINRLIDNTINTDIVVKNLLGSLLLYLPLGLYLPSFIKQTTKLSKYLITVTGVIIVIEISQLLLRRGSLDIDDVLLGLVGALIGFYLFKIQPIKKTLQPVTN